ncbi:MAG TPA: Wzz/FepE/Etk N-terminal domain-containing protein, partial [Sedimentisphaerales bacterium]|nr:Wzz/FepE/Etk N-terminal domain-containing protein [Sedimentisphaerales bacterium]
MEIDLFDYLLVIWRARWSIGLLCILAMAVTVVIVLTRPRYYESSVTIVPPLEMLQKELGAGSMGSLSNPLLRNALSGLTG